jgi:hypothetical protein
VGYCFDVLGRQTGFDWEKFQSDRMACSAQDIADWDIDPSVKSEEPPVDQHNNQ